MYPAPPASGPVETALPPLRTFRNIDPWPSWSIGFLIFMVVLAVIVGAFQVFWLALVFLFLGLLYPIIRLVRGRDFAPIYIVTNVRAYTMQGPVGPISAECQYCEHVIVNATNVSTTQIKSFLKPGVASYEHGDMVFIRGTQTLLRFEDVLSPKEMTNHVMSFIRNPGLRCPGHPF